MEQDDAEPYRPPFATADEFKEDNQGFSLQISFLAKK